MLVPSYLFHKVSEDFLHSGLDIQSMLSSVQLSIVVLTLFCVDATTLPRHSKISTYIPEVQHLPKDIFNTEAELSLERIGIIVKW